MNHLTTSEGCGAVFEEPSALIEINVVSFIIIFPVFISAMCVQVATEWPGLIKHPKVLDLGPSFSHLRQCQGSCWGQ